MTLVAAIAALVALAPQNAPSQQPLPAPAVLPPVDVTAAPVQAPNNIPADPAAGEDPMDRVTCRSEPVVGSRFNSRVCMTRREWAQRREESQNLARRLDVQNSNRGRVYAPTNNGTE